MNDDDAEQLRRDYQNIEAPPHLATRIRAEVADEHVRRRNWMPATATVVAAIAVVSLGPMLMQEQQSDTATPPRAPSFSMLSRVRVTKPDVPAPSLSRIRSVRTPAPPPKPKINPTRPQSFFDIDVQKETDYA